MDHPSKKPIEPELARMGLGRDLRRIRSDGAATAAELRDFARQIRGRRPQEVLGLVAQSGLARATSSAAVGTLLLLVLLTVVPYGIAKTFPERKPVAAQPAASQSEQPQPGAAAQSAGQDRAAAETNTAAGGAGQTEPSVDADVLEKLGVGETRQANPDTNPLEDAGDDLLKDLK